MVYRGHVENGVIRLDGSASLPEGAEVRVELADQSQQSDSREPTIEEELARIVADVPRCEWDRLPSDLSEHLDGYLYGQNK